MPNTWRHRQPADRPLPAKLTAASHGRWWLRYAATGLAALLGGGLIVLTLLMLGQRRALGWLALIATLIPLGDAVIVLSYGGSPAAGYGVHGVTALAVAVAGILLLREPPAPPRRVNAV